MRYVPDDLVFIDGEKIWDIGSYVDLGEKTPAFKLAYANRLIFPGFIDTLVQYT